MGSPGYLSFGPFRYDPEQKALFRGAEPVALAPKAIETLHALLENRGRIVEKRELLQLVWPDTTVEEVGLARNISILRKALGDEAEQPLYIETVPRRGYRFVGEVVAANLPELPDGPGPHLSADLGRPGRTVWTSLLAAAAVVALVGLLVYWQFYAPGQYLRRGPGAYASLAVIPFEALGNGQQEAAAFSRGLEEALAASLSQLDRVHVISPGTIQRYREKGVPVTVMSRLLGLDAVVEGTFQRSGQRIWVTARMPDIHSGKLIWAATYELDGADPAAAQSQAAAQIAAAVATHVQSERNIRGSEGFAKGIGRDSEGRFRGVQVHAGCCRRQNK